MASRLTATRRFGAGLVAFLGLSLVSSVALANAQPDIVVMLADDYGAREGTNIPTANGTIKRKIAPQLTPNIDALAAAGVNYINAYAAPVCLQARAMLMSGRWQQRKSMGHIDNNGPQPLTSVVMLPAMLAPLGYDSKIVGKWHLGTGARSPVAKGFSYWLGWVGTTPNYVGDDSDAPLVEEIAPSRTLTKLHNVGHVTDTIANKAVELLTDPARTKPLFLYVAFTATHDPLQGTLASQANKMDEAVGRIVAAARPGTLLIFAGDNGRNRKANGPLRGGKYDIWEGGVRVPFSIRWDGHIPAGQVETGLASLIDVAATVVAAAGGTLTQTDGINLLNGIPADRAIYLDAMYDNPDSAVRLGNLKFFVAKGTKNPRLYDLWADPGETKNIWSKTKKNNKKLAQKLQTMIKQYRNQLAK